MCKRFTTEVTEFTKEQQGKQSCLIVFLGESLRSLWLGGSRFSLTYF